MISKKVLITLGALIFMPIIGMELVAQPKPSEQDIIATLVGLPADIKGYLLQYLATADIAETEREILVVAATHKQLINNPHVMIAILKAVRKKVTYTAHAVEFAERLQGKTKTLPVMQHEAVVKWLKVTKSQLVDGENLYMATFKSRESDEENLRQVNRIRHYLENKNVDLNWENPGSYYKTALEGACFGSFNSSAINSTVITILLEAGASIERLKYKDIFSGDGLEDNYFDVAGLDHKDLGIQKRIANALETRKQKSALKQRAKQ